MPPDDPLPPLAGGHTAVLLMAYGGPLRLEDVEPYLLDVRGGRPTRPEVVEEVRERYRRIGGRSPILDLTRAQAAALERRLNRAGFPAGSTTDPSARPGRGSGGAGAASPTAARPFRVHVGMRHWHPFLTEACSKIALERPARGVAIAMAPQDSELSVGAYLRKLDEASRAAGLRLPWRTVRSWCDHPRLADAFAARVAEALGRLPAPARDGATVVFTAHSLPERILAAGDPYPEEVRRTIAAVKARLPRVEWRQAWQSAGRTGEPWLGPDAADVLRDLAAAGRRAVVVAPIGSLCDHVEILWDVDVVYRGVAEELGLVFERTASLNDDPMLIEALADLVQAALGSDATRSDGAGAERPRARRLAGGA
jgi:ferrochelatase